MLSNTAIVLPCCAGMHIPHCAITVNRPSVLSETVFPPVFGPVITSVSKSLPR